jgi:predicted MFS family arabinose efflux permease
MRASVLSPLKIPPFRALFSGQVLSDLGTWLDFTALTVLIAYHWQLGPSAVAGLMMAIGIPIVFVGPLVSVWADRWPRRRLMLLCVGLRTLIVLSFGFAPNLWVLLLLVLLRGVLGALFYPARMGALRSIVPEEQLSEALSLSEVSFRATQILAPALGGLLISLSGPRTVFVIEAALLLLATLLLARLPALPPRAALDMALPGEGQSPARQASFGEDLREGLRHIAHSRLLLVANVLMGIGLLLVFLYDGLLVLWTKQLGFGESAYGLLMSMMGLGSVIGAVATGQMSGWKKNPLRLMAASALLLGALNIVIGFGGLGRLEVALPFWAVLFLCFGMLGAVCTVPFSYLLQVKTPAHLIGRVFGVANAIQSVSLLLAPALGAALAGSLGVGGVFATAGGAMMLLAVSVLLALRRGSSWASRQKIDDKVSGEG